MENTNIEKQLSVKERISRISNELKVEKKGENEELRANFIYFNLEDITKALIPMLFKYRLSMEFDMRFIKENDMYRGELEIGDFDDDRKDVRVFTFDIPLAELSGVTKSQSAGATLTYCKRYVIMNVFHIADNSSDLDNSNNKIAKPDAKSFEKLVEKIKASKTPEKLKTWKEWVPVSGLTQGQKDFMLRTIEEMEKK